MKKTYKSEVAAALHEMMAGFHEAGAISKSTMREFDELCLKPAEEKLKPEEIKTAEQQNNRPPMKSGRP